MTKSVKQVDFSPRTFRVLALVYAVLSVTVSILLLVFRKDLVEEYNVKQYIGDEKMRIGVFLFGQFLLISNWSLMYGLSKLNGLFVKLHLYFMIGVFTALAGTLVMVAFMILSALVGQMDKENFDLIDMIGMSCLATAGLALVLTIGIGILLLLIAMINFTLVGTIETFNPIQGPANVVEKGDEQQTDNLKAVEV